MSLEISWFDKPGAYVAAGNFYGYHQAIVRTRAAMERLGAKWSAKSKIHFAYCAPHAYEYFPGKFNVLYTMYETPDIVPEARERVQKADLVIVPSKFCQSYFRKWTNKPVEVAQDRKSVV